MSEQTTKQYAHEVKVETNSDDRMITSYDHLGRIRYQWWPRTDAYLRVSYVDDGR